MKIIIYGSQYGTAREYGEELSRRTGIMAVGYKDAVDIDKYDTIIYIGALYAGSVLGMKKTLKAISGDGEKKIIIATVGLADPEDEENRKMIMERIEKQLSGELYSQASIHFLRGGIDYSRLNLKHRTMMAFVHKRAKQLSEEDMTAETRAIVETYGRKVSYVDFDALGPIIDEING